MSSLVLALGIAAKTGASFTAETLKFKSILDDNPLFIVIVRDPDPFWSAIGVILTRHPGPEATGIEFVTMPLFFKSTVTCEHLTPVSLSEIKIIMDWAAPSSEKKRVGFSSPITGASSTDRTLKSNTVLDDIPLFTVKVREPLPFLSAIGFTYTRQRAPDCSGIVEVTMLLDETVT